MLGWAITIFTTLAAWNKVQQRRYTRAKKVKRRPSSVRKAKELKRREGCLAPIWVSSRAVSKAMYENLDSAARRVARNIGFVNLSDRAQARVLEAWSQILVAPTSADETEVDLASVTMDNAKNIAVSLVPHCVRPNIDGVDGEVLRSIQAIGLIALAEIRNQNILHPF